MQWIDSCCIDKSSSAELSEAINSMFKWYQRAHVCYIYLSDVRSNQNPHSWPSDFRNSQWFTRGWTLQELLAPEFVEFFDQNWNEIGSKSSLQDLVSTITGISVEHLGNFRPASVAQKMAWASRRKTKRVEDEAYSLLGLFGVNMPPLYGEGQNAFFRLQLEILKQINDESLFAWKSSSSHEADQFYNYQPFAPAVRYFWDSANIVPEYFQDDRKAAKMTSKGLLLRYPAVRTEVTTAIGVTQTKFVVPLNCKRISQDGSSGSRKDALVSQEGLSRIICLTVIRVQGVQDSYQRSANFAELSLAKYAPGPSFELIEVYLPHFYLKGKRANGIPMIEIHFGEIFAAGFSLLGQCAEITEVYLDRMGNLEYVSSSERQFRIIDRTIIHLNEDDLEIFRASISFEKAGVGAWYLMITKNSRSTYIDLANLSPHQWLKSLPTLTDEHISDMIESGFHGPVPDRMSLQISENVYISAKIRWNRTRVPGKFSAISAIELSVDQYARWPSPSVVWGRNTRTLPILAQALPQSQFSTN